MNRQGIGLWIVVIALLVLDIGVHCVRAQDSSSKVIKTQELQIVDSRGGEVTDLSSDPKTGGAAITLYDPKGKARLGLYADNDGGVMQMFDTDANTVTSLDGSSVPTLGFYNKQNERLALGVTDDGASVLGLYDDAGNTRASVTYSEKDNDSNIVVMDKTGKQAAVMDTDKDGADVHASDPDGNNRVGMICDPDGTPTIYVADKNAKMVWSQTDQGAGSGGNADNGSNSTQGGSNSQAELHQPRRRDSN